jgi:hypothetical protein
MRELFAVDRERQVAWVAEASGSELSRTIVEPLKPPSTFWAKPEAAPPPHEPPSPPPPVDFSLAAGRRPRDRRRVSLTLAAIAIVFVLAMAVVVVAVQMR